MNALQRASLSSQLTAKAAELVAAKPGESGGAALAIKRARLGHEITTLVALLGGAALSDGQLKLLSDIASGKKDGEGLEPLLVLIKKAVSEFEASMPDAIEGAAQLAITHWAEFEESTNG